MTTANASTNAFAPRYTYTVPSVQNQAFSLYTFTGVARYGSAQVIVSVELTHDHDNLLDMAGWSAVVTIKNIKPDGTINISRKDLNFAGKMMTASTACKFADKQVRTVLRSWSNMVLAHELAERLGVEV